MRPEHQDAIRSRTEMAAKLYVERLVHEDIPDWSEAVLDRVAKECAWAALHFDMAEAKIHSHYHDLEHGP